MRTGIRILLSGIVLVAALAGPAAAQGKSVDLYVAKPLANGTVTITVTANGVTQTTTANILATDSATQKRDKIATALQNNGYSVLRFSGPRGVAVSISSLPNSARVTFDPGTTGENRDQLVAAAAPTGQLDFVGVFASVGADGQPALFSASVITPGGEVQAVYRVEPAFPDGVPGDVVAKRLFDMLAPGAAQLGASLTLNGDEIDVAFSTMGDSGQGVSFGATAASEGLSGSLDLGLSKLPK